MTAAPIKVYASRDFKQYRAVSSPAAAIAARFYEFMASDAPAAAHARYAYATAYSGAEPVTGGAPFAGSQLDHDVRGLMANPPTIVLAQGPMHPWGLFTPEGEAERQSIRSGVSAASGIVIEPASAVSGTSLAPRIPPISIDWTKFSAFADFPAVGGPSGAAGRDSRR